MKYKTLSFAIAFLIFTTSGFCSTSSCEGAMNSFSIVKFSESPSKYERILMTRLRNKNSSRELFRDTTRKMGELLVNKVVECLPSQNLDIDTPVVRSFPGEELSSDIELVSIMRSGDLLLEPFLRHFPSAPISKFLIQRDEETAEPIFKYMKLSPTLSKGFPVVIVEPMIATGGTLHMVVSMLKDKGILEENIIVASVCAAPEGLALLSEKYPKIKVVLNFVDQKLNEKKFIVPGLGDFGDRFFGTND